MLACPGGIVFADGASKGPVNQGAGSSAGGMFAKYSGTKLEKSERVKKKLYSRYRGLNCLLHSMGSLKNPLYVFS